MTEFHKLALLLLVLLTGCGEFFQPPGPGCSCPDGRKEITSGTYDLTYDEYPRETTLNSSSPFAHAASDVTDLKMTIDAEAGEVVFTYKRGVTSVVERWAR